MSKLSAPDRLMAPSPAATPSVGMVRLMAVAVVLSAATHRRAQILNRGVLTAGILAG